MRISKKKRWKLAEQDEEGLDKDMITESIRSLKGEAEEIWGGHVRDTRKSGKPRRRNDSDVSLALSENSV